MKLWHIFTTSLLAIPFFYLWNYLAPIYLPNLPTIYQDIPFWHCVALFALIGVIRAAFFFPCWKHNHHAHWC